MNKHTSRQLTVRVRNELAADADSYCAEVGLTFNALVAVALSDFLRLRRRRRKAVAVPSPAARAAATSRVGRNDPCPCGSGNKWKRCCGNPLRIITSDL